MNNSDKQRSTKLERDAAKALLWSLMEKAFSEGKLEINFLKPEISEDTANRKAKILHQSLNDYRKAIQKKKTESFEKFTIVNALKICFQKPFTVVIERKQQRYSNRTQTILDVAALVPDIMDTRDTSATPKTISDIVASLKN